MRSGHWFCGSSITPIAATTCAAVCRAVDGHGGLERLLLANAGLGPKAGMVLGEALRDNWALAYLDLCGNPLGAAGARAVCAALPASRRQL